MIKYYFSPAKLEIDSARLIVDIGKALKGSRVPLGERSYIKLVLKEIIERMERPKIMAEQEFNIDFPGNDGSYRLRTALGLTKCELEDILRKEDPSTAWIIIQDIIKELESKAYPDDESFTYREPLIYVARDIPVAPRKSLGNGLQPNVGKTAETSSHFPISH